MGHVCWEGVTSLTEKWQGLASGNSSSSAHFFVVLFSAEAWHGNDMAMAWGSVS